MDSGLQVGDKLNVKFLGRNLQGRYLISRKALLPVPANVRGVPRSMPVPKSLQGQPNFETGSVLEATITEVRDYGFMVELAPGVTCLLHNSQISHTQVCVHQHVTENFHNIS